MVYFHKKVSSASGAKAPRLNHQGPLGARFPDSHYCPLTLDDLPNLWHKDNTYLYYLQKPYFCFTCFGYKQEQV